MFKPSTKCNICKIILSGDTSLKKRIFTSTKFLGPNGVDSLAAIRRDYGGQWTPLSMTTHLKKHQTLDKAQVARMHLATPNGSASVPSEASLARPPQNDIVPATPTAPDNIFDEIMGQGLEALKAGELKMTTRDVLTAAKNKADLDLKRKDQNIKMQEMIWHFASGEASNAGNYDRKIIEGETSTAYDAASVTADNLTPKSE